MFFTLTNGKFRNSRQKKNGGIGRNADEVKKEAVKIDFMNNLCTFLSETQRKR